MYFIALGALLEGFESAYGWFWSVGAYHGFQRFYITQTAKNQKLQQKS
jgi:hypothetical protein